MNKDNDAKFIPKGGMCATCVHKLEDCTHLDFETMQKITKPDADGVTVVRCLMFEKLTEV